MQHKYKTMGHPVHPVLVAFPIAFYAASLVCFIYYHNYHDVVWFKMAVSANASGVVLALAGIIPAVIEWLTPSSGETRNRSAFAPVVFNIAALLLFGINLYLYVSGWNLATPPADHALLLSGSGFTLTVLAGFVSWKLARQEYQELDLSIDHEGWELGN